MFQLISLNWWKKTILIHGKHVKFYIYSNKYRLLLCCPWRKSPDYLKKLHNLRSPPLQILNYLDLLLNSAVIFFLRVKNIVSVGYYCWAAGLKTEMHLVFANWYDVEWDPITSDHSRRFLISGVRLKAVRLWLDHPGYMLKMQLWHEHTVSWIPAICFFGGYFSFSHR